ncbi:MAG: hypothetical protein AAGA65_27315 [Actinomycetota bacterium]
MADSETAEEAAANPAAADSDGDEGSEDGGKKKDKGDKKGKDKPDDPPEEPSARAGYIGLGLVGSLVVGFDPLRDAFQGNGSFENAVLRFLACVAVCVIGAGTIGRLIDASTPNPRELPDEVGLDADGNPVIPGGQDEDTATIGTGDDQETMDPALSDDTDDAQDGADSNRSADGASDPAGTDNSSTGHAGDAQKSESLAASSTTTGRQIPEQQSLTSSEETSR